MTTRASIALSFLLVIIVFILNAAYLGVVAEDAYISFRFAKNLASGDGLVWNVDEPPVEGYTNFLWVLISAAVLRAGFNLELIVQGIGVIAGIVTLVFTYLYSHRLLGLGSRLSLLPGIFLALSGPFATWASSGMETNLFTFLVLASTFYIVSYWSNRKTSALIFGFVLATLSTLTRPEGFGIFLILFGMCSLRFLLNVDKQEFPRYILLAFTFYLLPFSVYFLWRLSYFGYILPNTYYAKTGGTLYQWFRGAKYLLWFGFHYISPVIPLLIAVIWKGAKRMKTTRNKNLVDIIKGWIIKDFVLMVPVIICICYCWYIVFVGGDYMAMYRFLVPILPFGYILLAYVTSLLFTDIKESSHMSALAMALIIIALLGTYVHSTPIEMQLFVNPTITHGQFRGVLKERWHSNRLSAIGRFFNEYKGDEEESIATAAIGAVSYFSNLKTYDFYGTVDTHIAHLMVDDLGKGKAGHEKLDIDYSLSKKPTYFMFTRHLTMEPCVFPDSFSPSVKKNFIRNYDMVARWIEDKDNGESGYLCFGQLKPNIQQ